MMSQAIRAMLPVILRRYGIAVTVDAIVAEGHSANRKPGIRPASLRSEGDGYEVVRAMQNLNPTCVPMILTAYPAVESAVEGIHLRINDYIIKPSNADALVALLAEKLLAPRIQNADS
jgi:DNA-binding NtrC family response regulator